MLASHFVRDCCVLLPLALVSLPGHAGDAPATEALPERSYPATRTVDVVEDFHGAAVRDPYRWLEATSSPEVRAWAKAQDVVAVQHLMDDPLRARIAARMLELRRSLSYRSAPDNADVPARADSSAPPMQLALVDAAEGTHRVLTVRQNGGEPKVLVDPRRWGSSRDVTDFHLSPDQRHVAYTLSDAGSEWTQVRIRRLADDLDLPEVMDDMLWFEPAWTHDGEGFFYVRSRRPAPGEHTMFHSPAVLYHRVGTPTAEDRLIHATDAGTRHLALRVQLTPDGRHALVTEGEGAWVAKIGWTNNRRWLIDLGDARRPDLSGKPVPLTPDRRSAYELVGQHDGRLYFLTDRDAPRRRLVAVDAAAPGAAGWRDVIPQSGAVLDWVTEVHGQWVAVYLRDVQHFVRVFDRDGRLQRTIDLPPLTTLLQATPGPGATQLDLVTMSYFHPPRVTRHDLASGAVSVQREPVVGFDPEQFEARQVWYRSKDGTRIPMFVVHRRGIALDGTHPTALVGYGASHQSMMPGYGEGLIAWLELGGAIAVPNLRGGGEFGREWYEAATRERKQTTFDDFIAAAEWLIEQGYTSPSRLAIQGESNGGLLVSATLAQRPELFRAAVAGVPNVDVLRFDRGRHTAQFGHRADPAVAPSLLAYAPLRNIAPGTCYPATLVTTALNDERAPAWEAFKLAATLQAAQSCPRPVLLRARDTGGHLGDRGPNGWVDDQADQMAFVARQLGIDSAPVSGPGN